MTTQQMDTGDAGRGGRMSPQRRRDAVLRLMRISSARNADQARPVMTTARAIETPRSPGAITLLWRANPRRRCRVAACRPPSSVLPRRRAPGRSAPWRNACRSAGPGCRRLARKGCQHAPGSCPRPQVVLQPRARQVKRLGLTQLSRIEVVHGPASRRLPASRNSLDQLSYRLSAMTSRRLGNAGVPA